MATGSGYGKVILFGEHFVVHGLPAIASAINDRTTAEVTIARGEPPRPSPGDLVVEGKGWTLLDRRPATPGYKSEKAQEQKRSIELMLDFLKVDTSATPLHIVLGGELRAASGVGASAASCAAIARALSGLLGLGLDDGGINRAAHEGEKGYHGTPSGIDDTAATYGGLFLFKRGQPRNTVEPLRTKGPVEIVMGNTGLTASTSTVVAEVRARKAAEPEMFAEVFSQAEETVKQARAAIEARDLPRLGTLMDLNHDLLVAIGVSCEELERLVSIARREGALGAKLTGTGRGGYMIALTPGRGLQAKVAGAMRKAGFEVLETSMGK